MKITYIGHSCILIENGKSFLIDPFIKENPLSTLSITELHPDYILVTHAHHDHLGDTIEIAKKNNSKVIACNELAIYLSKQGVSTIGMNIGGKIVLGEVTIKMTNAIHSSSLDSGENCSVATGFLIFIDDKCIYHAGDTDLFYDMKEVIGLNKIDIAFLPIGGHWTMDEKDAITAIKWLNCKNIIPIHYNTFKMIEKNPYIFKENAENQTQSKCIILAPGEKIEL